MTYVEKVGELIFPELLVVDALLRDEDRKQLVGCEDDLEHWLQRSGMQRRRSKQTLVLRE
jgi:hypothetical protein